MPEIESFFHGPTFAPHVAQKFVVASEVLLTTRQLRGRGVGADAILTQMPAFQLPKSLPGNTNMGKDLHNQYIGQRYPLQRALAVP